MHDAPHHLRRRSPSLGAGVAAAAGFVVVACLLAPVLIAALDAVLHGLGLLLAQPAPGAGIAAVVEATSPRLFDPAPAFRGVLVAAGIATLAVFIALPVAVATASRRWAWSLLAAPMLMPPYLAYSGWGVVRDPTWLTGRWIVESGLAGSVPKILAFIGLALWAWPVAAMIVGASVRTRDTAIADAIALEPISAFRRAMLWMRMHRASIVTAWVSIAALMLGSAIPLHLAQFQTGAIRIWLLLDQTVADDRWRVWLGAWPLLFSAAVATWLLTSTLVNDPDRGASDAPSRSGPDRARARCRHPFAWRWLWTLVAVTASVLVPLGLFALTLGRADAITRFVDRAGDAFASSASIALSLGLGAVVLCTVTAWGAGARVGFGRWLAVWMVRLGVFGALVPGVLVGDAWVRALGWPGLTAVPLLGGILGDVRDHPVSIVLAQGTRLAFVPVLAGWWMARREPAVDRDSRALDRAEGPVGWWRAWGARWPGLILGAGMATLALSMHEIEATVLVQPPGVDVLARLVLDDLHFERPDQRSAAGLLLMFAALGPALLTAIAVWPLERRTT